MIAETDNNNSRIDLRNAGRKQLEEIAITCGHRPFNGRQLYEWIWKKNLTDFSDATNLPAALRAMLSERYVLNRAVVDRLAESVDGTIKFAFRLHDGNMVEGVLIPLGNRMTACISSQAGCALACSFCATGLGGYKRNLTAGEIYDQAWLINDDAMRRYGHHLSNIVLMGMGEPLLNFEAVKEAVIMVVSEDGMAMSPRRITISTVGIPDGIRAVAQELPMVKLAVSLHTVNDHLRSNLIPVNRKHSLSDVKAALVDYHAATGNRFSIEYLLLDGVNDSRSAALELAAWCRSFPVKINIIPYNKTGQPFTSSPAADMFKTVLEEKNMVVTIRRSRGDDIDAACGQLISKE